MKGSAGRGAGEGQGEGLRELDGCRVGFGFGEC